MRRFNPVGVALAGLALAAWASAVAGGVSPPQFIASVWNPEDLELLPGSSWVIVSGMRSEARAGRLFAIELDERGQAANVHPLSIGVRGAPPQQAFAPHGISARGLGEGRFELWVVDHGGAEAIDRFELRVRGRQVPVVERASRLELPKSVWANAVVAMPDGSIAITSMYDPRDPAFIDKFAAASPTGGVWTWSQSSGWKQIDAPRMSGANGIAASSDGRTLFVSEWAARRVWSVPLDDRPARSTVVPFLPDNLRWTADGQLLVAGQNAAPQELFHCTRQRRRCPMGFTVGTVDPATLVFSSMLSVDEEQASVLGFGGGTGAIQIGPRLWVGSFTGARIASFPLPF